MRGDGLRRLASSTVDLTELVSSNTRIWDDVIDIAQAIPADAWTLIGGQMVALHGYAAGRTPPRLSRDVDMVANIVARPGSIRQCASALRALGFVAQPTADGRRLHRFVLDERSVDLLAPDHPPRHLVPIRLGNHSAVSVDGGTRALQTTGLVTIRLRNREASIPLPALHGAVVLKARAARADSRDSDRHVSDLAFLLSTAHDPLALREEFSLRDRQHVRRLALPTDPLTYPWLVFGDSELARAAAGSYAFIVG